MISPRDPDQNGGHIPLLPLRIIGVVVGSFLVALIIGIPVFIGGLFLLIFGALSAGCDGSC